MIEYTGVELPMGLLRLIKNAEEYNNELEGRLSIKGTTFEPLSECFGMIHDRLLLSLEILHWYYSLWSKGERGISLEKFHQGILSVEPHPDEAVKQENAERVMEILRALYVLSMSSIEFSAKRAIDMNPSHALNQAVARRIYLRDVMKKSMTLGLIDSVANSEWQDLIFIRNCVVHNNGISDSDRTLRIEGMEIVVNKGRMIRGKLDTFAVLTRATLRLYRDWSLGFITHG
ncbi:MAG: hypothetical protein HYX93_06510 [Chloroflexi bacterium]|nr:hypothetical protein [Chloroflexota bacterium]